MEGVIPKVTYHELTRGFLKKPDATKKNQGWGTLES
jgi:hypothetical protein